MTEDHIALDNGEEVSLGPKLGEGSFGVVYQGFTSISNQSVAVKLEPRDRVRKCLGSEASVLQDLQSLSCVPRILGQGLTRDHAYIVMELLGESLNEKFKRCGRMLSLPTVLMVAEKSLAIMEAVHRLKFIHRDIKPHNFLLGLDPKSELFLVDFGLSKKYSDSMETRTRRGVTGTIPFVSLNLHLGSPAARRDDLESLGYMFVYLLKGKLPWFNCKQEKLNEFTVKRIKEDTTLASLCEGLPGEFEAYLRYTRSLRFEQEPDYKSLRVNFRILARKMKVSYDWQYDWIISPSDIKASRRQSSKSIRSVAVSYTARLSGSGTIDEEEKSPTTDLATTPKRRPTLDISPIRLAKLKSMSGSQMQHITISLTKSNQEKGKKARKFQGLSKLKTEIRASRGIMEVGHGLKYC